MSWITDYSAAGTGNGTSVYAHSIFSTFQNFLFLILFFLFGILLLTHESKPVFWIDCTLVHIFSGTSQLENRILKISYLIVTCILWIWLWCPEGLEACYSLAIAVSARPDGREVRLAKWKVCWIPSRMQPEGNNRFWIFESWLQKM